MSDLSPGQEMAHMFPLPASRPTRETFSADQLASMDAEAAGHVAACADPYCNGEDAHRRYEQGVTQ
jgi:hypothetical protein